ncbi:UNVERIFIED_CONTAM: hypothetical protein GTU68_020659 [Idotea baltica]|nr:hypothetical protein [Idotea baltica]
MNLEKTWRWFGDNDSISLSEIKQIDIEGIVTALHHIPNGAVWTVDEIKKTQNKIEQHGMKWSVVESLPVHECLKHGGKERDQLIENYKLSLENLGKCGIHTICYNFMPVIDWIRTNLDYKLPNGNEVLYFNFVDFVVFDLFILERKAFTHDYPEHIIKQAQLKFEVMTNDDRTQLIDTIIVKTQGFIDGITADNPDQAITIFKQLLESYTDIDDNQLRENLKYFLDAIMPTAEKYDIKMCIHPDDPPMKVLGLPRIVSSREDIKWIFDNIPSSSNGLTFCTGSLGAGIHNNLNQLVKEFSSRIHFAHLRSTQQKENGDFFEAEHLEGSVDMYNIISNLLLEIKSRKTIKKMPMRVDHGRKILSDFNKDYHPGYPLLGRMKAMAEISGMTIANMQLKRS